MKKLLFSSILIISIAACSPRHNSDAEDDSHDFYDNHTQDTTIVVVDTLPEKQVEEKTEQQAPEGGSKKPGSEQPKPKSDNPSAVDSIKKTYPPKK
jgi:hypothetical protein